MITITNSLKEKLEIESELKKSITTDIKMSVEGMQLLTAIQAIDTKNLDIAMQAKSMMKFKDMEPDKLLDLSDRELEAVINLAKSQKDNHLKITVAQDLIKYFGLEEAQLSIANISRIYNFVTADTANSFRF
jgi:hypothetical protein